ncbi:MAG: hypothetical protein N4A68_07200 [Maledivibacter sp.]|jgi:hypothetical protein|nr:hypothetical protein [Maledivibacter sp.]
MKIPDLVGIGLEDASKILEDFKKDYQVSIRETLSPFLKSEHKNNECRVVRQQVFDNTIIITVSYF